MADLDLRGKPSTYMKGYLYSYPTDYMHGFLTTEIVKAGILAFHFFRNFFYLFLAPSSVNFGKENEKTWA